MPRQCRLGWVEEYAKRLEDITGSPLDYHYWTALTLAGACLKRHVWYDRVVYKILPNLYTVLVGRPAIGKGTALGAGVTLIKDTKKIHMLSDRLTMEYVLEKMSKGFVTNYQGKLVSEASVLIVATELSAFLTASQFSMTALTDLWESREGIYGYGTRGRGEWPIDSPCISMLAATTQEFLLRSIPADAIGNGFTRRVNFVFAKKESKKVPWPKKNGFLNQQDLIHDFEEMAKLRGEMKFADAAKKHFEKYFNESDADQFDDQSTAHYKSSRWANALKVAMVLSASEGDNLIISEKNWLQAEKLVDGVTSNLRLVFRAVGESDLSVAADKILQFVELKGYASFQEILFYLWRDVTRDDLVRILTTFTEAGILSEKTQGGKTVYLSTGAVKP